MCKSIGGSRRVIGGAYDEKENLKSHAGGSIGAGIGMLI